MDGGEIMLSRLTAMFAGTLLAVTLVKPIVAFGKDSDKAGTQTVTGCLAQGDEANEYSIKAEDGKTYGLRSSEIKLADHLNHKVTVTGKVTPEKHSGKVDAKTGKREEDAHMKVSNLTMVSPTCP